MSRLIGGRKDDNSPESNAVVRIGNFCTGTLINSRIILTALHCYNPTPSVTPAQFDIRMMAGIRDRLYAGTNDNKLLIKDLIVNNWKRIVQNTLDIVAMTNIQNTLYAVTRDNRLMMTEIGGGILNWQDIGDAPSNVFAMSSTGNKILAVMGDQQSNELVEKDITVPNSTWNIIMRIPANNVVCITVLDERLFYVAGRGTYNLFTIDLYSETPVIEDNMGQANGIEGLIAIEGMLYGARSDGKLVRRSAFTYEDDWQVIGDIDTAGATFDGNPTWRVKGMSLIGNKILAAMEDHQGSWLSTINVTNFGQSWRQIDQLNEIVVMAGNGSNLYCIKQGLLPSEDPNISYDLFNGHIVNDSEQVNWTRIGQGDNLTLMAATDDRLYGLTAANAILVSKPIFDNNANWQVVDSTGLQGRLITMTGIRNKLYAITRRESGQYQVNIGDMSSNSEHVNWRVIAGHTYDAVAMAATNNKLYLVTNDRNISMRHANEQNIVWQNVDPWQWQVPGKWYTINTPIQINFGADSNNFTTVNAIEYCLAGQADIMLLKLQDPVPIETAIPMRVLTMPPENMTETWTEFWQNKEFIVKGWGRNTIRQIANARNAEYPSSTIYYNNNAMMMNVTLDPGVSIVGGDSGSPLIWEKYMIGICQGANRYTVTFVSGGHYNTDYYYGGGIVIPNISKWIRRMAGLE